VNSGEIDPVHDMKAHGGSGSIAPEAPSRCGFLMPVGGGGGAPIRIEQKAGLVSESV
jgi:hypothetical protein